MAGFTVSYERMLARITQARAAWTGSALTDIGAFAATKILEDSTQSFRLQADPTTGQAWIPSHRALAAFQAVKRQFERGKRKKAPTRTTTLLDTGRLRQSVRSDSSVTATGRVVATGGTLPLAYAAIHQFGGDAGRGHATHLPARPYVGLTRENQDRIRDYMIERLRKAL